MSNLIHSALTGGLVSKVETSRQVGTTLYFKAHGSAPGQPRIVCEATDPAVVVVQVLVQLGTLSPKKSPRGDEAIELLRKDGWVGSAIIRDEDPPEPDKKKKVEVKTP